MWFKKTDEDKGVEVEHCHKCKCLIQPIYAHKVDVRGGYSRFGGFNRELYCMECAPKYKLIEVFPNSSRFYGEVEMTQDGTPVGYKKINNGKET